MAQPTTSSPARAGDARTLLFAGLGEMPGRFRTFDWSETPLGPVESWPQSLRTAVTTMLGSQFPSIVLWGPELTQLYNDGYREIMGAKHPGGLGIPTRECWPEAWGFNEPIYKRVRRGESVFFEDVLIPLVRYGKLEDVYFTLSYSPILDERFAVAGVLVTLLETTARVEARRLEEERGRLLHQVQFERRRLGEAFEQAPGFLAVLRGEDHVFEIANESYLDLVGRRDIVGMPVAEALPEVREQGFIDLLDRVLRTGEPFRGNEVAVTLRPADGIEQERVVDFIYQPLVEADGTRSGIVVHGTDVTEKVRARAALQASESRLRDVFEQAPMAVAVLEGPRHVYSIVSPTYHRYLGNRQLLGLPFLEAVPEPGGQRVAPLMDRVYVTGEPVQMREQVVPLDRDGDGVVEEYLFDISYQPLRDHDGNVYAITSLSLDVTEQVRARRLSEEATKAIAHARDEVERLLAESESARVALAEANEQLEEQQLELELTNQQLQENAAELEAQTEELQMQAEELETQTRLAEQANRAKSDFLATMSHELRTPLNAIGGYADLLLAGVRGELTDPQREDVERLRRSGQHLLGLINDILNFTKLDAGQVEFTIRPTPLADLLTGLEDLLGPQLASKSIRFSGADCDARGNVEADADKARQILLNLLTNAVKFTDAGGSIAVSCDVEEREWARIRVRDTGRGIPADQLSRVFDPFVQVDRHLTPSSHQGVGLGLAISRDLATGMGGRLTVESEPARGSTFTLWLRRSS